MGDDVTICIVDDDDAVRRALLRLLESGGFRTRGYASAQALLADAASCRHAPAVVLTDLLMPGMGGLALAEHLANLPSPPAVVFLSAHGDVSTTVRAMRDGAVDF